MAKVYETRSYKSFDFESDAEYLELTLNYFREVIAELAKTPGNLEKIKSYIELAGVNYTAIWKLAPEDSKRLILSKIHSNFENWCGANLSQYFIDNENSKDLNTH